MTKPAPVREFTGLDLIDITHTYFREKEDDSFARDHA